MALTAIVFSMLALCETNAWAEPPQFGVEVGIGSALGLSSYLRNVVLTEPDLTQRNANAKPWLVPSLADVESGRANSLALRLVTAHLSVGLSFQYFELPAYTIHHRGQRSIPPNRQRADGSVDDSGVAYKPIDPPITDPIAERVRDALMIFGLGGAYRIYWPGETFDIFIPLGAELVLTHVTRPAAPYRLGLGVASGVGTTIKLSPGIALVLDARLHALATGHYGRRGDSARRSAAIGESTESAFFSTLIYASVNLAVQFRIR